MTERESVVAYDQQMVGSGVGESIARGCDPTSSQETLPISGVAMAIKYLFFCLFGAL
jgi:hypothetical protein